MGEETERFCPLDYEADEILPVPYIYREKEEVLLIAANPDEEKDVWIKPDLSEVLQPENSYQVSVLFGETPEEMGEVVWSGKHLSRRKWLIKRDKTSRGGLLVLKIKEIQNGQEASI